MNRSSSQKQSLEGTQISEIKEGEKACGHPTGF